MTYDNSSVLNNPIFYVNGVATTSITVSTPTGTPLSDAALNLSIGNDSTAYTHGIDGVIDEVRIYNRILSATEIRNLYGAGR